MIDKNGSQVSLQNENQTLAIQFNETENEIIFTCNASNKFGSVVLTYTLKPLLRMYDSKTSMNLGHDQSIFYYSISIKIKMY